MQPNQPDLDPSQPIAQPAPQTQPAAPQYEASAPQPQPYQAPVATAAPFEALVTTSPIDTLTPAAQPESFTSAPQTTAPIIATPESVPAPSQKASHKALFIILAAVIGLVIVVASVYLAVTLTTNSN